MARLIRDRFFTRLAKKIEQVRSWPGIRYKDIAAALAQAEADGTIEGHDTETAENPLLDIVITVCCESVPATFLYARDRMEEVHGARYSQSDTVFDRIDEEHVRLVEGAKPFTPHRIKIEVVDLGANWEQKSSSACRGVKTRPGTPASFAVIYAASESPDWVRQMDALNVPEAAVPGILLNVPGPSAWGYMPLIRHDSAKARLSLITADANHRSYAMPTARVYGHQTSASGGLYR